jgi:RNA recognition motif-containing protein
MNRHQSNRTELLVENIPGKLSEADLLEAFSAYGTVLAASLKFEWNPDRSSGVGRVTMANPQEAQAAIEAINGKAFEGRTLSVKPALVKSNSWDWEIGPTGNSKRLEIWTNNGELQSFQFKEELDKQSLIARELDKCHHCVVIIDGLVHGVLLLKGPGTDWNKLYEEFSDARALIKRRRPKVDAEPPGNIPSGHWVCSYIVRTEEYSQFIRGEPGVAGDEKQLIELGPDFDPVFRRCISSLDIRGLNTTLRDPETDSNLAASAGQIFESARSHVLASGQSVLQSDNGMIYEIFPDGRRIPVKQIDPPTPCIPGSKYTIR